MRSSNLPSVDIYFVENTQQTTTKLFEQVDVNKSAGFDNVHRINSQAL